MLCLQHPRWCASFGPPHWGVIDSRLAPLFAAGIRSHLHSLLRVQHGGSSSVCGLPMGTNSSCVAVFHPSLCHWLYRLPHRVQYPECRDRRVGISPPSETWRKTTISYNCVNALSNSSSKCSHLRDWRMSAAA